MKLLLTGASGLVGSHVLDCLLADGMAVRVLLRPSSSRRFIKDALLQAEIATGAIDDPGSLPAALEGVSQVIHCAGCTKALDREGYYSVNHTGTLNLVAAINQRGGSIQRLIHISSLAAAGPAISRQPSRENDPCHPITDYGRSKLAGEAAIREQCRIPWVILRPPGVYGPRDGEFLKLFKAVQAHLLPRFGGGRQELSLVYVKDLAKAIVHCLRQDNATGKIFNVAHPKATNARQLAEEAARQLQAWTVPLPLPNFGLWPICAMQELINRLTGKPNVINLQKYAELTAPGWVCDVSRLQKEAGFGAPTALREGLAQTLAWYRQAGWLR
jgi:dihydroflavonol-4-reductase